MLYPPELRAHYDDSTSHSVLLFYKYLLLREMPEKVRPFFAVSFFAVSFLPRTSNGDPFFRCVIVPLSDERGRPSLPAMGSCFSIAVFATLEGALCKLKSNNPNCNFKPFQSCPSIFHSKMCALERLGRLQK